MLPRVADTAVDLQALLGDLVGLLPHVGVDDADDLLGGVAASAERVQGGDHRGLAGLEFEGQVGHHVLEGLERADRPAERDAVLRIVDRHREELIDGTDRLGAGEGRRLLELVVERGGTTAHERVLVDGGPVEAHVRHPARQVEGGEVPHRHAVRIRPHEHLYRLPVEGGDDKKPVGLHAVLHEAARSRYGEGATGAVDRDAGAVVPLAVLVREGPGDHDLRGNRFRQQLGAGALRAVGGDGSESDIHRNERSRLHVASERLGDQCGVGESVATHAATARVLRNEHREPAELGGLHEPISVEPIRVIVERPGSLPWQLCLDEPGRRLIEQRLIVGQIELDGHGPPSSCGRYTVPSIVVTGEWPEK